MLKGNPACPREHYGHQRVASTGKTDNRKVYLIRACHRLSDMPSDTKCKSRLFHGLKAPLHEALAAGGDSDCEQPRGGSSGVLGD